MLVSRHSRKQMKKTGVRLARPALGMWGMKRGVFVAAYVPGTAKTFGIVEAVELAQLAQKLENLISRRRA